MGFGVDSGLARRRVDQVASLASLRYAHKISANVKPAQAESRMSAEGARPVDIDAKVLLERPRE